MLDKHSAQEFRGEDGENIICPPPLIFAAVTCWSRPTFSSIVSNASLVEIAPSGIQLPSDVHESWCRRRLTPDQSPPKKTKQWKPKADGLFAVVCGSLVILGQGCSDLVQMHVPESQTLGGIVFN